MAFSGSLREIAPSEVIQLIATGRKTGTLTLTVSGATTLAHFRDGRICHAACGESEGEEVIYEALALTSGAFSFDATPPDCPTTITRSAESLMLEGVRRMDHWARMKGVVPQDNVPIMPAPPGRATKRLEAITPAIEQVWALVDGQRTLGDIMRRTGLGRFAVSEAVFGLVCAGMVVVGEAPEAPKVEPEEPRPADAAPPRDRRSEPRIVCWRELRVGHPGRAERIPALLQTVSENGARLVISEPLDVGSMIYVELALRKGLGADAVPATAVWLSEEIGRFVPDGCGVAVGVKFLMRQWRLPDLLVAAATRESGPAPAAIAPDRRRAPRVPRRAVALLRTGGGKTPREVPSVITDMSATGARVRAECPMEPDELVYIVLCTPDGLRADSVPAIVRWGEPLPPSEMDPDHRLTNAVGIEFVRLPPGAAEWVTGVSSG